jgi:hypothetical protein
MGHRRVRIAVVEEIAVVIFPDIRISELRRERDARERAFERSRQRLVSDLKDHTRPLTFIREHPQLIVSTLITLLSTPKVTGKALKFFGVDTKKGLLGKLLRFGWLLRAFRLGVSLLKNFRSAAA